MFMGMGEHSMAENTPTGEREKKTLTQKLSWKERLEEHKGAGYGAMIGAVGGAAAAGPLAPLGAAIGGAVGGGIGGLIDLKWRHSKKKEE